MTFSKTAQLVISCGLFLLFLFISFSIDLALTLSISSYLFLSSYNFIPIFIVSGIIFLTDVFFRHFDVSVRFISDLSLDGYILFLTAVVLYLRSSKDFINFFQKLRKSEKKIISQEMLFKFGASFLLALLFYPTLGGFVAAVLGYLFFSYITRQFNGKIAIGIGLCFLFPAACFLLVGKASLAEDLGNFVFLFLVVGTIQEVVNLMRRTRPISDIEKEARAGEKAERRYEAKHDEKEEKQTEKKEKESEEKGNLNILINRNIISMKDQSMRFPKISFPHINPRLLLGGVVVVAIVVLVYFFFPRLSKIRLSISIPKLKIPPVALLKKSPSPTASPSATLAPTVPPPTATAIPTPILKVTTESAKLKIFVQNGTDITGLAASTSAKLKKAGFINIKTGNAETQDYANWQLTTKKEVPDLSSLFKNILELTDLKAKEATIPAGFDILIIAGREK